jgi:uncharacterized cofD-like protein
LVNGIPEAIRKSSAVKIYIRNIMTQPGETVGFSAADHLRAVIQHCADFPFDYFSLQPHPNLCVAEGRVSRRDAVQIEIDIEEIAHLGALVVFKDLLAADHDQVRHDPLKLSQAIFELVLSRANREFHASPLQSQAVSL